MKIEMSGFRKAMFFVATIFVGACGVAEMGVNPALEGIFETYGHGLVGSYVAGAPCVWMGVSSFACAALMSRFSKKRLIVAGLVVFGIGSIFCVSIEEAWYFAIMRSLMGIGEGIINTILLAYLAQMFVDKNRHAQFIGAWNFCTMLLGAALSYFGGIFASPEWTGLFVIFWPTVAVLVITVVFVPELDDDVQPLSADSPNAYERDAGKTDGERFGGLFYAFFVGYILFSMMIGLYKYFTSEYVSVTGLGSYDVAGAIMTANTLAGAIASIFFGKIYIALRKKLAIVCSALGTVALAMMFFWQGSLAMAYVASVIFGVGYGLYFSYMFTMVSEVAPRSKVDQAIGLINGGYSLTFFAIAYLVNFLRPIVSPDAQVVIPQFLLFATLGIVAVAIELATLPAYRRKGMELDDL